MNNLEQAIADLLTALTAEHTELRLDFNTAITRITLMEWRDMNSDLQQFNWTLEEDREDLEKVKEACEVLLSYSETPS
jgi:hypothetical protein